MSSSKFCPSVGVYAAIRIDPAAMVAHLDTLAAEEAQAIRPKTYLIFTAFVRVLRQQFICFANIAATGIVDTVPRPTMVRL